MFEKIKVKVEFFPKNLISQQWLIKNGKDLYQKIEEVEIYQTRMVSGDPPVSFAGEDEKEEEINFN